MTDGENEGDDCEEVLVTAIKLAARGLRSYAFAVERAAAQQCLNFYTPFVFKTPIRNDS